MYALLPILVAFCSLLAPGPARAITVNAPLELVLAFDVSGTVDDTEFDQQRLASANALRDSAVQSLIVGSGGVVATLVYWAGTGVQVQSVPWTPLASTADANAFANAIEAAPRATSAQAGAGQTGMTRALTFATSLFSNSATSDLVNTSPAPRRVIDVAGDGSENLDVSPSPFEIPVQIVLDLGQVSFQLTFDPGWGNVPPARDAALAADITIHGLPIRPQLYDPPLDGNQQTETRDATRVSQILADLFPTPTDLGDPNDPFTAQEQAIVDAAFAAAFLGFETDLLGPGQTEITQHEWFYRDFVIGGPDSFLVFADTFGDVQGAIRSKFLQEIPEPRTFGLLALGVAGLVALRRRQAG